MVHGRYLTAIDQLAGGHTNKCGDITKIHNILTSTTLPWKKRQLAALCTVVLDEQRGAIEELNNVLAATEERQQASQVGVMKEMTELLTRNNSERESGAPAPL